MKRHTHLLISLPASRSGEGPGMRAPADEGAARLFQPGGIETAAAPEANRLSQAPSSGASRHLLPKGEGKPTAPRLLPYAIPWITPSAAGHGQNTGFASPSVKVAEAVADILEAPCVTVELRTFSSVHRLQRGGLVEGGDISRPTTGLRSLGSSAGSRNCRSTIRSSVSTSSNGRSSSAIRSCRISREQGITRSRTLAGRKRPGRFSPPSTPREASAAPTAKRTPVRSAATVRPLLPQSPSRDGRLSTPYAGEGSGMRAQAGKVGRRTFERVGIVPRRRLKRTSQNPHPALRATPRSSPGAGSSPGREKGTEQSPQSRRI